MSDINSFSCTGRVGADPELKHAQGGMAILEIRFAVGGRKKSGDKWIDTTTWLRTTAFTKRAEALSKLIHKGDRIGVQGRLEVREFERKDGTKGTSVEVFADDIVLLSGKPGGSQPYPRTQQHSGTGGLDESSAGFEGGSDDDIPF